MSAKTFADLVAALREVRAARMPDDPSNREIARALKVAPQTVGNWFAENNGTFPQSAEGIVKAIRLVAARAQACGIAAPDGLLDPDKWREAHRDEASRRAGVVSAAKIQEQAKRALAPGRALTGALGPFEYEVHRPVQAEDETGLPTLPPYVARAHDTKLAEVTRAAAGGRSGIAVMVGGSSTGKTRACWEAVQSLISPDAPWHLWHPIAPSRPEAALKDVPHVTPRTVVWLNDAQFYLDTPDSQGEKVAAALRELLRDDKRGPVLILATLWPEHWSTLTARPGPRDPDPHPQARELLSGRDIPVPEAFTPAELSGLAEASDPRLRRAAALSTDGEVTQFLAGAPELLSRYHNAGSSARALIDAAMDARRLGMGEAIPLSFLEQAAPAYLTDRQWNSLADDWLPESLTYTGKLCKGVLGPLTKIRERPGHSSASREDTYRLADYLDQHARRTRRLIFPPSGFWTAAGKLADPGDLQSLGKAAADRGLLRQAARLHKRAATYRETRSAADCLRLMNNVCPGEPSPAGQLIENVTGYDGLAVADALKTLRETGAEEQALVLLTRGMANVALDDPDSLRELLYTAEDMGAGSQIAVLLARDPASHVALDHMLKVNELLEWLHEHGEREQASVLARRAARDASLKVPRDVCHLLEALVTIRAGPGGGPRGR